mmetsp:Transcript_19455/g.31695  ORF Transcript_19455/g.31695 Transcript_19455/m.31695 type:complete len:161 (+) Transcript_19455:79-561(+)
MLLVFYRNVMAGNIEETLDVDFQQENTMDGVSRQHLRHGMDGVSKNESPPTNASGKRKSKGLNVRAWDREGHVADHTIQPKKNARMLVARTVDAFCGNFGKTRDVSGERQIIVILIVGHMHGNLLKAVKKKLKNSNYSSSSSEKRKRKCIWTFLISYIQV